jgi:hypothetical protein
MAAYLRRFLSRHLRNGILGPEAFKCNEGSLSYYMRNAPLDTVDGARELCEHHSARANYSTLGAFELSEEDLLPFGLAPRYMIDEEDERFGELHYESVCFEAIYLEDAPQDNMNRQLMNRKKSRLAVIAAKNIVINDVTAKRPPVVSEEEEESQSAASSDSE